MFYVKTVIVMICVAALASCSPKGAPPPPTGFASLDAARTAGLNFECTGTQCDCDATAPIDSTRTCVGMVAYCRTRGAETITCGLNGAMTCTCEFALPD